MDVVIGLEIFSSCGPHEPFDHVQWFVGIYRFNMKSIFKSLFLGKIWLYDESILGFLVPNSLLIFKLEHFEIV